MSKKRYWRPEGWDPIDHNENVADELAFRRSAMFHKAWINRKFDRRSRRLHAENRRRYWFGMRPLGLFRRKR